MNTNKYKSSLPAFKSFINSTLNPNIISLAKTVGFVKRNDGKILPETFVKAFTIGMLNVKIPTLQAVADTCESIQENLSITKEAIYQRLKIGVSLLKEVFNKSLEYSVNAAIEACSPDILKAFNNVYIADSTIITLSKRMAGIAPGRSAKKENGSLCVQSIFSLVNRCFKKIEIFWGTHNDVAYTEELANNIGTDDLVIFDMGYKNKLGYKEIMEKKAFFLTRASHISVYYTIDKRYKYTNRKLEIVDVLKKSNGIIDIELLLGSEAKRRIKCRLVAIRLPEKIVNERTRKAYAKRRKSTLTKKELELLKWNIFITNVSAEKLSPESICNLYRLRWQIEILFKACKSHLSLGKLGIGGKHQTECILYGRLITATIMASIYSKYYAIMFKVKQRELSVLKFFSNIENRASEFIQIVFKYPFDSLGFSKILSKIAEKSLYERRKRKTSLEHLIG